MKTWASQNMNMRQRTSDFTKISVLSMVSPQAEIYPMGSNMAEPLMLVFLMSVLTQKSAELREVGLVNAIILTCQSAPFHPHFYSLLWLPILPLQVQLAFRQWIRIGDPLGWIKVCAQGYPCPQG